MRYDEQYAETLFYVAFELEEQTRLIRFFSLIHLIENLKVLECIYARQESAISKSYSWHEARLNRWIDRVLWQSFRKHAPRNGDGVVVRHQANEAQSLVTAAG